MDLLGLARRRDQLRRITEVARVLHRYDLADWVQNIPRGEIRNLLASHETQFMAERPWEERVRLASQILGPRSSSWAKYSAHVQTSLKSVWPPNSASYSAVRPRSS